MKFLLKLFNIPSGHTVPVDVLETWTVRWWCMERTGGGSLGRSEPCVEVFAKREEAEAFQRRLWDAAALLQDGSGGYGGSWRPVVSKNVNAGLPANPQTPVQ